MALSGKRGVMTHVEDLLGQNLLTLSQSMRLLGLLSVCGLNDDFNAMLSQVLLCHGHKHLSTAHSLEMMGLHTDDTSAASIVGRVAQAVNRKSASVQVIYFEMPVAVYLIIFVFKVVDKKLKLIFSDGELAPDKALPAQNMSYVFGGSYTPVVGRILEWIIKGEPMAQVKILIFISLVTYLFSI
jgi:hypothetical protein